MIHITMTTSHRASKPYDASDAGDIEIRVSELSQLFNSLDPSPFHQKELDPSAEEYIVGSARDLPTKLPTALVIYLDAPAGFPTSDQMLGEAIRVHFSRRAKVLRWELRDLLRRGWISLCIGLAFLAACLIAGEFVRRWFGPSAMSRIIQESLLIGGWVAMWRPLEIFLYDWWPIKSQCRLFERISEIPVRVAHSADSAVAAVRNSLFETAVSKINESQR